MWNGLSVDLDSNVIQWDIILFLFRRIIVADAELKNINKLFEEYESSFRDAKMMLD